MKLLGKGTYSQVFDIGNERVMKKYKYIDSGIPNDMIREIATLKRIKNPYVIELLQFDLELNNIELPFYGASLYDVELNTLNKKSIFQCICLGIYSLHNAGIVHRDIKPNNIMIKDENTAIIIDTGFAKIFEMERNYGNKTPKVVTLYYRAPEVILKKEYSFEIDVWSAGCVLGELYLEEHLFDVENELGLLDYQCLLMGTSEMEGISKDIVQYMNQDKDINKDINKDIVKENIKNKKNKKFSVKDIKLPYYLGKYKEYFSKYGEDVCELIEGMLKIDFLKRFTIADCLNSKYFNLNLNDDTMRQTKNNYEDYLDEYMVEFNYNKISMVIIEMRKILVSWMLETTEEYQLPDSVYFRSVILLDRFICKNSSVIRKENIQLIGMACLFISSKYETLHPITSEELVIITDKSYTISELHDAEKMVCKTIDFNIATPILYNYISIYSKELDLSEEKIKNYLRYLQICTLNIEHYKYQSSVIAAMCAYIASRKNLEEEIKSLDERDLILSCKNEILGWIKDYEDKKYDILYI